MFVGEFNVTSSALWVSDPCYSKDVWCAKNLDNALNGTWIGHIETSDEGPWGNRVSLLRAIHKDFLNHNFSFGGSFEVGVDSGQMGIFDSGAHPNETGEYDDENSLYSRICNLTLSKNHSGVVEHGVVSSSGFGDGSYQAQYFLNSENKIVMVEVDFIPEEEHNCEVDYNEYGRCNECGSLVYDEEEETDNEEYTEE